MSTPKNIAHYPVPTGFFFARSDRILLSNAAWNSGQVAVAVGYAVIPEVPAVEGVPEHEECTDIIECVPDPLDPENPEADICTVIGEDCVTVPEVLPVDAIPAYSYRTTADGTGTFPDTAMHRPNSLAALLNAATESVGPYLAHRYGALPPDDPDSVIRDETLSCVLYNVKTWRVTGSIIGQSFDYTVPAGSYVTYTDGELITATLPPTARTYLATFLRIDFQAATEEDPAATIWLGIGLLASGDEYSTGGIEDDPTDPGWRRTALSPVEIMHTEPTLNECEPLLGIIIQTTDPYVEGEGYVQRAVATAGTRHIHGSGGVEVAGEGESDPDLLFLGRELRSENLVPNPTHTDRPEYSLAITVEEYWPAGEWYRLP